jgi:hypothetical protein
MARYKMVIHLLDSEVPGGKIDTYCGRRVLPYSLAVIDDPDGVTCAKCKQVLLECRRAKRIAERRCRIK